MFYIKSAGIPVEDINIEQNIALKEFKQEISDKGGLYSTFHDVEEFRQL